MRDLALELIKNYIEYNAEEIANKIFENEYEETVIYAFYNAQKDDWCIIGENDAAPENYQLITWVDARESYVVREIVAGWEKEKELGVGWDV